MIQQKTIEQLKQVLKKYRTQVKKTNTGVIIDGIKFDFQASSKNINQKL